MELIKNSKKYFGIFALLVALSILLMPDMAEAGRRGGSFGGSRSFGSSRRSFGSPSRPSRPSSFGNSRGQSSSRNSFGGASSNRQSRSSMGSTRMSSSKDYTSKYGTPRKTETRAFAGSDGVSRNYQFNSYGGFGSGLMMGYMMGHVPWYWSTPFHGAYYYSQPYQVTNPDGTISVYPPTFSFSKLLFTLLIAFIIIFLIRNHFRRRRGGGYSSRSNSSSSFG